jgi:hypothetical protein
MGYGKGGFMLLLPLSFPFRPFSRFFDLFGKKI